MEYKKLKLAEEAYDFIAFAIASANDDYYLAMNLNDTLSINLNRCKHPMLKKETGNYREISYFNCVCNETMLEYSLIGNTCDKFKLFPKLASIDFVLKISGNLTNDDENRIANAVRSVKGVTACISLNVKKTSSLGILARI